MSWTQPVMVAIASAPRNPWPCVHGQFAIQQLYGSKKGFTPLLLLTWRFEAVNTRALSAAPCLDPCLVPCHPSRVMDAFLPLMRTFLGFYLYPTGLWDAVGLQPGGSDFHALLATRCVPGWVAAASLG